MNGRIILKFHHCEDVNLKFQILEKNVNVSILIKITHCQDLDRTFLQNCTTDFDETLHVAWVCPGEGFGTTGTSGYSPVYKKGGRRPP